jgi:hypothetical protein
MEQPKAVQLKHGCGRLEVSSFGGDDVRISLAIKDREDETFGSCEDEVIITREDVPNVIQLLTQVALEAETAGRRKAEKHLRDYLEEKAFRRELREQRREARLNPAGTA